MPSLGGAPISTLPAEAASKILWVALGAGLIVLILSLLRRKTYSLRTQKLQEILALRAAVLGAANCAILSTNKEGLITFFNRASEKMLGYSAVEVVGKYNPGLWHDPTELANRAQAISAALGRPIAANFEALIVNISEADSVENEWTLVGQDGRRLDAMVAVSPLLNDGDAVIGYLFIIRDISAQKKRLPQPVPLMLFFASLWLTLRLRWPCWMQRCGT